jgi:hypothetical protein
MTADLYVGDVGFFFDRTVMVNGVAADISEATVKEYLFGRPDTTCFAKTPSFVDDGTDGELRYVTQAADIDMSGSWKLQVHVTTPTLEFHSQITNFEVGRNLVVTPILAP